VIEGKYNPNFKLCQMSEVEEVQLRIVQQVRQLEEQGQITIVRGDSDDQFI